MDITIKICFVLIGLQVVLLAVAAAVFAWELQLWPRRREKGGRHEPL